MSDRGKPLSERVPLSNAIIVSTSHDSVHKKTDNIIVWFSEDKEAGKQIAGWEVDGWTNKQS